MAIEIEKIIPAKDLKHLSPESIQTINESINKANAELIASIEQDNADKFNALVENITNKFDNQVDTVILESFKGNVNKNIDNKMYSLVKDMVNLLENAGITATEKTKEVQEKLMSANKKLEDAFKEREEIKEQLDESEKENFILAQCKGLKPEVVNHAIEYFKNKDILDVQDSIKDFVGGNYDNLELGSDDEDEMVGDISLDKVKEALDQEIQPGQDGKMPDVNKDKSKFESLGKGLKQQRVNSPNVSGEELKQSVNPITESAESTEDEEETKEAMAKIDDFNSLGYNFN